MQGQLQCLLAAAYKQPDWLHTPALLELPGGQEHLPACADKMAPENLLSKAEKDESPKILLDMFLSILCLWPFNFSKQL